MRQEVDVGFHLELGLARTEIPAVNKLRRDVLRMQRLGRFAEPAACIGCIAPLSSLTGKEHLTLILRDLSCSPSSIDLLRIGLHLSLICTIAVPVTGSCLGALLSCIGPELEDAHPFLQLGRKRKTFSSAREVVYPNERVL